MNKIKTVIYAPYNTFSGYGSNSRDKIKSIIELYEEKWDIKLISCNWGNTPKNFIEENPEWEFLNRYELKSPLNYQPDIMIWITIPSEAQPIGKWNCCITAVTETTIAPPEFIEGCNRMDLTLVSSNHSKRILQESKFEKRHPQTNQVEGIVELNKPVEVLFEGASLEIFKQIETKDFKNLNLLRDLNQIPESFNYLFVGHWMGGDLGEDRKNVGLLIKTFLETFKNKKNKPGLILKTSQVGSSYMDRDEILKKIKQIQSTVNSNDLPNVYLLHGEFKDSEINEIYNHPKVKAMISLTKGEGFGRPLLEFTLSKKPLLTTNWSGHTDFLNPEFIPMVGGNLVNVHPSAANQFLLKESQWFSPDIMRVNFYLKDVFENYKNYIDGAKRQAFKSKNEFSYEKMKEKMDSLFTQYIPEFAIETPLKLPTLNTGLKLPSLQKATK